MCHQRGGMKTVSPGACTNSSGRCATGRDGYTSRNQAAGLSGDANARGRPPASRSTATPGTCHPGGYKNQRLAPVSSAFHALVEAGSQCQGVPERAGPTTSHR